MLANLSLKNPKRLYEELTPEEATAMNRTWLELRNDTVYASYNDDEIIQHLKGVRSPNLSLSRGRE